MKFKTLLSVIVSIYLLFLVVHSKSGLMVKNTTLVIFTSISLPLSIIALYCLQRTAILQRKNLKLVLSVLCIVLFSTIDYIIRRITNQVRPCYMDFGQIHCGYVFGFPFPFWMDPNYSGTVTVILGLVIFIIDVWLWIIALTFLFKILNIRQSQSDHGRPG